METNSSDTPRASPNMGATEAPSDDNPGVGSGQGKPKGGDQKVGRKKPCSQAQREASRRNARHSTGPRTPEGKAKVRLNALKHGILSDEVLLTQGDVKEDAVQYEALYRQMMERYHPRDILEELEVKKIIVATWRLGRLLRYEMGSIRMEGDSLTFRQQLRQDIKSDETLQKFILRREKFDLYHNPTSIEYVIQLLSDILNEMKAGNVNERSVESMLEGFPENIMFTIHFRGAWKEFKKWKAGNPAELQNADSWEYKDATEGCRIWLDEEIRELEERLAHFKEKRRLQREAILEMARIPDEASMNRIIRYGSYLEGIIARSMATLERLQGNNGNNGSRSPKWRRSG